MAKKDEEPVSIFIVNMHALALMLMFAAGGMFGAVYQQHAEMRAMRIYQDQRQPWGGTPVNDSALSKDRAQAAPAKRGDGPCGPDAPWSEISIFLNSACLAIQTDEFLTDRRKETLGLLEDEDARDREHLENFLRAIERELLRRRSIPI